MDFPPNKTLVVEGNDDLHVTTQLLKQSNIEPNQFFRVEVSGGYEKLIDKLPDWITLHQNKNNARLGVMVDANDSLPQRWESVTKAFKDAGYDSIPNQPQANGLIIPPFDDFSPRIGIWVMPDNQNTGMLEDFTRFLVPENDTLIAYAEECVNNIAAPLFRPSYKSKAVIHTWLAWKEDPGKPLGHAIISKYLEPNCTQASIFVQWLKELFE